MKHARSDYNARIQDVAGLIPDDEPVILIRAQDGCALPAIDAWLTTARQLGVSDDMMAAVLRHRGQIDTWQAEHGFKVPDAPAEAL